MTRNSRARAYDDNVDYEDDDDFDDGRRKGVGGLPYKLLELAMRHPLPTAGVVASLMMVTIVAVNATAYQTSVHPSPFFETRARPAEPVAAATSTGGAPLTTQALPSPKPQAVPAPAPAVAASAPVAPPQVAPVAAPRVASTAPAASIESLTTPAAVAKPRPVAEAVPVAQPRAVVEPVPLVRDLQTLMAARGLYAGPVDGLMGPATAGSLRNLERSLGRAPTGEPSAPLLAAARARPVGVPFAAKRPVARPAVAVPVASAPATAVPIVAARPAPAPAPVASTPPASINPDPSLARIQKALNAGGFGATKADGRMDDLTVDAIRRYEYAHGWPVTGRVSDKLSNALLPKPART